MSARLAIVLGLVLAAASVASAEQSHEAPAQASAAHEPATSDPKDADHGSTKKKVPRVSRVVAPAASQPAAQAPAADAHAPTTAAHAPAMPHAPATATPAAPSTQGSHGGYVATGSRSKAAAVPASGKAKPVVSGTPAVPKVTVDEHGSPAPVHDDPAASEPTSTDDEHGSPARPATRGLARLSDVHERIAAALASVKDEAGRAGGRADAEASSEGDGRASSSRAPRITLRWPAPRWRVVWPSTAASVGATPAAAPAVPALHATPAVTLPAPAPVSAQPPDRH